IFQPELTIWPNEQVRRRILQPERGFSTYYSRLSPDGKWLAYASEATDLNQIYVERFPSGDDRRMISSDKAGGLQPEWRSDGRELYYRAGNRLVAVPVTPGSAPESHRKRVLFEVDLASDTWAAYQPASNGNAFLVTTETGYPEAYIVTDWESLPTSK
ncbi:MAG: PD40 domain-containing protein, partial [Acidobacteria bacterium]|nr:PD40 domain-containing protein [Acidobacteriota bacterium]